MNRCKFILLLFLWTLSSNSLAKTSNTCAQFFKNSETAQLEKILQLEKKVSHSKLAEKFNYSLGVLARIKNHYPDIYLGMLQVSLKLPSKYSLKELKGVELFRGIAVEPKDYDPTFAKNYFGENTQEGINWFSKDSAMAYEYAVPREEELLESKSKKTRPMGMIISFTIPQLIVERAEKDSFRSGINIALDRKYFPNESAFISDVSFVNVDFKNKTLMQGEYIEYENFLKFLKGSKFFKYFLR